MLITFYSKAHADILLVGKPAGKILELLGFGTKIPGAIKAQDVSQALSNLRSGVAEYEAKQQSNQQKIDSLSGDDAESAEEKEPPVSLAKRAFPVIELLEAAIRDEEYVSWK